MGSTAAYAFETTVTLLGVLLLAVIVIWSARRLGMGRATGPLTVLGRLPLENRKSVYVVRVGNKTYALLSSESGLSKLDDLDGDAFISQDPAPSALEKMLARARFCDTKGTPIP
jgi:flagellar biogenesis protein FliO